MKASTIDVIDRALADISEDLAEISELLRRAGGDAILQTRLDVLQDALAHFGAELDKRKITQPLTEESRPSRNPRRRR